MLSSHFVEEKFRKLSHILNVKHVDLDSFVLYFWEKNKQLEKSVFCSALLSLSKMDFRRFPSMADIQKAIGKAYEKYQESLKQVVREDEIPIEDRPSREDWKQLRGVIDYIADEYTLKERNKPVSEYKTNNKYMIEQFKKNDKELTMKREIKAAKKRREDPNFQYQEWN